MGAKIFVIFWIALNVLMYRATTRKQLIDIADPELKSAISSYESMKTFFALISAFLYWALLRM
jgi:hypothetical protein